ncbi:MAG: hypothetical protein HZC14_03615, partial [Candidatus Niyogibacteria bacterium]|nr:hypothetical protein [Candidatus Niyogibacteria bacterium]
IKNAFEMTDSVTGDIYCVRISNGEWNKFKGTCGEYVATPAPVVESAPIIEPAPESMPASTDVTITPTADTAATTTATTSSI